VWLYGLVNNCVVAFGCAHVGECSVFTCLLNRMLKPGEKHKITVSFFPQEASVFVAAIICNIDHDKILKQFTVSAVSKYAFIAASEQMMAFGDVFVGQTIEKEFTLSNRSMVRTSYAMEVVDHDGFGKLHEPAFVLSPTRGSLEPNQTIKIKV
jgi:hypothetical protein